MKKKLIMLAILFVAFCSLSTVYAMGGPVPASQEVKVANQMDKDIGADISKMKQYGLYDMYDINDKAGGNGNGVFDTGDYKTDIIFYAGNSTDKDIMAEFTLKVNNALVIVNDSAVKYLSIPAHSQVKIPFSISPKQNMPSEMRFVVTMRVNEAQETAVYNLHFGYVSMFGPNK